MPAVDPLSLIYLDALVSAVLTVVLLASRIGLQDAARGVRTWIAGDLLLCTARVLAVLEAVRGHGLLTDRPIVPAGVALCGVVLHLDAIRRVRGGGHPPLPLAVQALGLGALYALPFLAWPGFAWHTLWFHGLLATMAALTLHALWPLRHGWGARLMSAVMVLAVLLFIANAARSALGFRTVDHLAVVSVLVDVLISLILSAGFMLMLQERLRERIERLVVTDALTGTLNRHGLMPLLERELATAQRHGRALSVTLFDLDHFKRVNDQHGHAMGDQVLAGFAARVHGLMRGGDLFGRWGGEEFLLVLPDTGAQQAERVADRIRESVAQTPLAAGAPPVTVSGGIAAADTERAAGKVADAGTAQRARELLHLLDLADKRLYVAKQRRNRVVAQTEEPTRATAT
jgi:diguanylate cyclase (GGDEF)-like protein